MLNAPSLAFTPATAPFLMPARRRAENQEGTHYLARTGLLLFSCPRVCWFRVALLQNSAVGIE